MLQYLIYEMRYVIKYETKFLLMPGIKRERERERNAMFDVRVNHGGGKDKKRLLSTSHKLFGFGYEMCICNNQYYS